MYTFVYAYSIHMAHSSASLCPDSTEFRFDTTHSRVKRRIHM